MTQRQVTVKPQHRTILREIHAKMHEMSTDRAFSTVLAPQVLGAFTYRVRIESPDNLINEMVQVLQELRICSQRSEYVEGKYDWETGTYHKDYTMVEFILPAGLSK